MDQKDPKIKSGLGITNMNGISSDDDRSGVLTKACTRTRTPAAAWTT